MLANMLTKTQKDFHENQLLTISCIYLQHFTFSAENVYIYSCNKGKMFGINELS